MRMRLVLRLVATGVGEAVRSVDVLEIARPGDLGELAALGLSLVNGKQLLAQVQQAVVAAQSRDPAARPCSSIFCRSLPGSIAKPCAGDPGGSANSCARPPRPNRRLRQRPSPAPWTRPSSAAMGTASG